MENKYFHIPPTKLAKHLGCVWKGSFTTYLDLSYDMSIYVSTRKSL